MCGLDLQEGYARLEAMIAEVERVREIYGGVGQPVVNYDFGEENTRRIHNAFKDCLRWMPPDVREEHDSSRTDPHKFGKSCFSVYFNRVWDSKAFFMHLVRYGTACDIRPALEAFSEFKKL